MIPVLEHSRKGKTMETVQGPVVARGFQGGKEHGTPGSFRAVKLFHRIV